MVFWGFFLSFFSYDVILLIVSQPPKSRSHSWKVSPAMRSIWNATSLQPVGASSPRPVTAPNTPPSTRGQKRVISLDGLRLQPRQVKRPREGETLNTNVCTIGLNHNGSAQHFSGGMNPIHSHWHPSCCHYGHNSPTSGNRGKGITVMTAT